MRGICIDTGATTTLEKDREYYLFEDGPNNFYVSNFDRVTAHLGSYQRKHFKVIEEKKERQYFLARVNKYQRGFRMGDEYIITNTGENGYFHIFSKANLDNPFASFIDNFFEIIEPFDMSQNKSRRATKKVSDTNRRTESKKAKIKPSITKITIKKIDSAKKKAKTEKESVEQLTIFDLLEG